MNKKIKMQQKLIQIHKEIMELAQEQESCNSVLGMMLSSAECLSSRFGIQNFERLFNGYNIFESGDTKNEESLKVQLRIQTKLFRNNYFYTKEKKGKYIFPDNFDKQKIIEIINIWKKNVSDDKKIYYNNIIDIITDKKTELKYPNQSIDKIKNNGVNQNVILNVMVPIMSYVDQGLEEVGREAELKGNIDNNLKLGKKKNNDHALETHIVNINDINHKKNEKRNELRDSIVADLLNCFSYGECYYVLSVSDNNYRTKYYKKEVYKNQKYFDIQNKFKEGISELIKKIKIFNDNYGDSETIINTINDNFNNAYIWKCRCQDTLFEDFYKLLNSSTKK